MPRRVYLWCVLLFLTPLFAGCGSVPDARVSVLQVTVSIVPQRYFLERLGGDLVSVNVMVLPGENPATYEPKADQLVALTKSRAYFRIGVAFENAWMDRIRGANQEMLIVDTRQGIELLPLAEHDDHGQTPDAHGEGNLDPHIWLSPDLVKIQARTIRDALVILDPENRATFDANLAAFDAELESLKTEIASELAGITQRKFVVFHPSWGYFANDFRLEMVAIEIGGQEPSAAELAMLISEAQSEGIKVVFAQPEFSTRSADTIARQIGGKVLLITPLAYDWANNLRSVAAIFGQALGE